MSAPAKYEMPRVSLGDVVLWRHTRNSIEPAAALVTKVGQCAVSVLIFPTDSRAGIPKDGVRHSGDPELARIQTDSGVFDFSDGARRLAALEEVVRGLSTPAQPAPKQTGK